MSTPDLLHTCAACGAEESLDTLLMRMIDDDEVRRLIADVVTQSLPLGGLVVRYLRLHKPPKQRLRMGRVREVLAELVPDMQAERIRRKGREWAVPRATWRVALQAVFDAHDAGSLKTPLTSNAYLYEIAMRQADRAEAEAERERHQDSRSRAHTAGPGAVSDAIQDMDRAIARTGAAIEALAQSQPGGPAMAPKEALERLQDIKRRQLGANTTTTTKDEA